MTVSIRMRVNPENPLEAALAECKEHGFDGIELMLSPRFAHTIARRRRFADYRHVRERSADQRAGVGPGALPRRPELCRLGGADLLELLDDRLPLLLELRL